MTPNARGALAMTLAMMCFVTNDLMVKGVLSDIPTGQAMVVRGLFAILFALIVAWRAGAFAKIRLMAHPAVVGRSLLEGMAAGCFLTALGQIPFATLSATLQLTPLFATALAALILKEQVGWRRWSAMAVGLGGMAVILQPWAEPISTIALLGVAASMLAAMRDVTVRGAPPETPTMLFALGSVIAIMGTGGLMSIGETWRPMTSAQLGLLAGASIFIVGANFFISKAMRNGEISFVAPFRYTMVFWAVSGAWIAFGEEPGLEVFVGGAIIIAAGLYTFQREQMRKRPIASRATPTSSR